MKAGRPRIPIMAEGQKIYLYKKGSRGELLGVYNSIDDLVKLELPFLGGIRSAFVNINNCLSGRNKSFTSFYHQCRVKAVLK